MILKTCKIKTVITLCLISVITYAQNSSIETKNSTLSWTGNAAFNTYSLTGTLKVKSGTIKIENDSIKELKISIDMKSLNHENGDLTKHLKGKDFFEVNTYTEATFTLSKPVLIENAKATISGKLTIKDMTKDETFMIKLDENNLSLSFDITIDLTAYGVKFNSPSFFKKMKENGIADDFVLKGQITLH